MKLEWWCAIWALCAAGLFIVGSLVLCAAACVCAVMTAMTIEILRALEGKHKEVRK